MVSDIEVYCIGNVFTLLTRPWLHRLQKFDHGAVVLSLHRVRTTDLLGYIQSRLGSLQIAVRNVCCPWAAPALSNHGRDGTSA